jgi:hypothetical protein
MLFSNLEQEMSKTCLKRAHKAVSRSVSAIRFFTKSGIVFSFPSSHVQQLVSPNPGRSSSNA